MESRAKIELIVIGTSKGGGEALRSLLTPLPVNFPVPILAVRHQPADGNDYLITALNRASGLTVKYAEDEDRPRAGTVHIAPPDRHLLVGGDGRLLLSSAPPVNHSRPAIDPLFESAARWGGEAVLAVVLTGMNQDGAQGVRAVKKHGGRVIVQDPESAEADVMPRAALAAVPVDEQVWLSQIGPYLWSITR